MADRCTAMSGRMLGASHQWGRCWCYFCRPSRGDYTARKRAWRARETQAWKREAAREVAGYDRP